MSHGPNIFSMQIRQLRDHTLLTEEKHKTEIDYLNRAVSDLQYSLLSTTEYTGMDTNDTGYQLM